MTLEELARRRNNAAAAVQNWMYEEGMAGNLRQNSEAPGWLEYLQAQHALNQAVEAVGLSPTQTTNEGEK